MAFVKQKQTATEMVKTLPGVGNVSRWDALSVLSWDDADVYWDINTMPKQSAVSTIFVKQKQES